MPTRVDKREFEKGVAALDRLMEEYAAKGWNRQRALDHAYWRIRIDWRDEACKFFFAHLLDELDKRKGRPRLVGD